jgi:glycosyltransferase involved in cell wall biosynthesis
VARIVRTARTVFPVIAVNDGSTDDTGQLLEQEKWASRSSAWPLQVVRFQRNRGKGAALRAGFAEAEKLGCTHAITIDADGQHHPGQLPEFAAASREQPEALIIGVRDLLKAKAPARRRISNRFSSFWFKVETGLVLADTQCGYRCYPLQAMNRLAAKSQRYAYELEVIVKAAWSGVPLVPLPVWVDYAATTSRLSHFNPWNDLARISLLHARLLLLSHWRMANGQ